VQQGLADTITARGIRLHPTTGISNVTGATNLDQWYNDIKAQKEALLKPKSSTDVSHL
jgi:hypothetical protein